DEITQSLTDGEATIPYTPSADGDYSVTATFDGNGEVAGSESKALSLAVSPEPEPEASVKNDTIDLDGNRDQYVTGSGFTPGETVGIVLHSTAIDLGTTKADANGDVAVALEIPADLETGSHSIELTGEQSGVSVSAAFDVVD